MNRPVADSRWKWHHWFQCRRPVRGLSYRLRFWQLRLCGGSCFVRTQTRLKARFANSSLLQIKFILLTLTNHKKWLRISVSPTQLYRSSLFVSSPILHSVILPVRQMKIHRPQEIWCNQWREIPLRTATAHQASQRRLLAKLICPFHAVVSYK